MLVPGNLKYYLLSQVVIYVGLQVPPRKNTLPLLIKSKGYRLQDQLDLKLRCNQSTSIKQPFNSRRLHNTPRNRKCLIIIMVSLFSLNKIMVCCDLKLMLLLHLKPFSYVCLVYQKMILFVKSFVCCLNYVYQINIPCFVLNN